MPRKSKTLKKGGYYGFGGPLSTGAVNWKTGTEQPFSGNRGGNGMSGGKRRTVRKGRKGTKGRKVRRGGSKFGATSASFVGTGSRGMINVVQNNTKGPGAAALGAFNDKGAHPGNFSSFKGLLPK
jgi:hypothetical protein